MLKDTGNLERVDGACPGIDFFSYCLFPAPFAPIKPTMAPQRSTGKYDFSIDITRPSITVMNISLDPLTS
ncbi:hypothetical protein [Bacillus atrophaeus]|nr:hypothetical protein [Bacillus atrophaeus]